MDVPLIVEGMRKGFRVPQSGGKKILCVGDSFTYCSGLSDGETWPSQMNSFLKSGRASQDVSTFNAGLSNTNAIDNALLFESYLYRAQPDCIVWQLCFNDAAVFAEDNSQHDSGYWQMLKDAWAPDHPDFALLRKAFSIFAGQNIPVVVFYVIVTATKTQEAEIELVSSLCEEFGFHYVEVMDIIDSMPEREKVVGVEDKHLSAGANKLIAKRLSNYIKAHDILGAGVQEHHESKDEPEQKLLEFTRTYIDISSERHLRFGWFPRYCVLLRKVLMAGAQDPDLYKQPAEKNLDRMGFISAFELEHDVIRAQWQHLDRIRDSISKLLTRQPWLERELFSQLAYLNALGECYDNIDKISHPVYKEICFRAFARAALLLDSYFAKSGIKDFLRHFDKVDQKSEVECRIVLQRQLAGKAREIDHSGSHFFVYLYTDIKTPNRDRTCLKLNLPFDAEKREISVPCFYLADMQLISYFLDKSPGVEMKFSVFWEDVEVRSCILPPNRTTEFRSVTPIRVSRPEHPLLRWLRESDPDLNKRLAVYTGGSATKKFLSTFDLSAWEIVKIIDSSSANEDINGIPVETPEEALSEKIDYQILVTCFPHYREIKEQLEGAGLIEKKNFFYTPIL